MATRNPKNITIGEGRPGRNEGRDGDMTIRTIRDMGTMLFVKAKGRWFNINLNKDLKTDRQQDVSYALPGTPRKAGELRLDDGEILTKNQSGKTLSLTDTSGTSLNEVSFDTDLSDTSITSYAIDTSVIEDGNTLTVGSGVEFAVSPLDPSVDEEQRINKRLRFDAEVAYSLGNIHNKFNYLKNEVAGMNTKYCNRLVAHLSSKDLNLISEEEKASLTQPRSRPAIGGNWTFDFTGGAYEDLWTCTVAHGLVDNDRIKFTTSTINPAEFSLYTDYYVIVKSATTVQLKRGLLDPVVEGTADSSGNWKAHMAYDNDGEFGGLPYSDDYMPGSHQPDLVEGENYTTGGVCSLSDYKTENSCIKAGGTWYPTETV